MDEKAEYRVATLITRGTADARVLAEPRGSAWGLPASRWLSATAIASVMPRAVAERFGLEATVLSGLHAGRTDDGQRQSLLVALDAFGARSIALGGGHPLRLP